MTSRGVDSDKSSQRDSNCLNESRRVQSDRQYSRVWPSPEFEWRALVLLVRLSVQQVTIGRDAHRSVLRGVQDLRVDDALTCGSFT
jgi:hypothetical protein